MKILFLSANFPPEGNAPATRTSEHARIWVKNGASVKVITCTPNFPEGKIYYGFSNKWLAKDMHYGVQVWRVKTFITENKGSFKRKISFLSYMISSLFFGIFFGKADIVIGTSPQFFTAVSAWALAGIKRAKFVFEVRDIWPASIVAVGAMKRGILLSLLEKLEMFLYKRANLVVVVTKRFKEELIKRGVDPAKIKVITNGSNIDLIQPQQKSSKILDSLNLKGKFVVGYIGTHGMAHALDKLIEAANIVKDYKQVHFLFVGAGSNKIEIDNKIKQLKLENVSSLPRQEKPVILDFLSVCDLSLVSLRNVDLFKSVIPSKIFESMAMGIPILCSIPKGEATEIIEGTGSGWTVPPEDPIKMADKILKLSTLNDDLAIASKNCLLAAKSYSREKLAQLYLQELQRLL